MGGREKYEHCDNCGLCLPKSDGHKCRSDISKTNCPVGLYIYYLLLPIIVNLVSFNIFLYPQVCMEDLHTSRDPAHIPPCSHLIHTTCYREMLRSGLFACPTCGLSMQVPFSGSKSIKSCNFVFSQWTGQPWTER